MKKFDVIFRGKVIGYVIKEEEEWGYYSELMEIVSGGISGHFGMKSKDEAEKECISSHLESYQSLIEEYESLSGHLKEWSFK